MAGYQIERCVLKTCNFLKTQKVEQIIEKVSLCLGVFDKIEVATNALDEATILEGDDRIAISIKFACALVKSRARF